MFAAAKLRYQKAQISELHVHYRGFKFSETLKKPPSDEDKQQFAQRLFTAECDLLKTVDFKLEFIGLFHAVYSVRFARLLYGQNAKNLDTSIKAIANDSFATYVNILFPLQTVALACVLLAAAKCKFPLPLVETELK